MGLGELVSKLTGRKVAALISGGKGIITIKGELKGEDEEFIELEIKGYILGGKPKTILISKAGIAGLRIED